MDGVWEASPALVKAFLRVLYASVAMGFQDTDLAFEQVCEGTGDGAVVGNEPATSEEPL